ncbi:hypothetical protein HDV00_010142 [Rhizophlyctis rosea]|nr:hypothetical protein HDV00_010142 [Rhizophlyctis rosea]
MLTMIKLTNLKHVSVNASNPVDHLIAHHIVEALTIIDEPLELGIFEWKGTHFTLTHGLLLFFAKLQPTKLRKLVLTIGHLEEFSEDEEDFVEPPDTSIPRIPASTLFKSLQSLQITPRHLFENISVSTPILQSIHIDATSFCKYDNFKLNLTQRTLTHFAWEGNDWEASLSTLPVTTLKQLTSVTVSIKNHALRYDLFWNNPRGIVRSLPLLHHLTSFTMIGDHKPFPCTAIKSILLHTPRLKTFIFGLLTDWDYQEVRSGLVIASELTEVLIATERVEMGVLNRFRKYPAEFEKATREKWNIQLVEQARRVSKELQIPKVSFWCDQISSVLPF